MGCGHSLSPSPSPTGPSAPAHPSSGPRPWLPPPGHGWVPMSLLQPLGASQVSPVLLHRLEPTTLQPRASLRPHPPGAQIAALHPSVLCPGLCRCCQGLEATPLSLAHWAGPQIHVPGRPPLAQAGPASPRLPHCRLNPLPGGHLVPPRGHWRSVAECLGRERRRQLVGRGMGSKGTVTAEAECSWGCGEGL